MFELSDLNPLHHPIVAWCICGVLAYLFARYVQKGLSRNGRTVAHVFVCFIALAAGPIAIVVCLIISLVCWDDVFGTRNSVERFFDADAPKWL